MHYVIFMYGVSVHCMYSVYIVHCIHRALFYLQRRVLRRRGPLRRRELQPQHQPVKVGLISFRGWKNVVLCLNAVELSLSK